MDGQDQAHHRTDFGGEELKTAQDVVDRLRQDWEAMLEMSHSDTGLLIKISAIDLRKFIPQVIFYLQREVDEWQEEE